MNAQNLVFEITEMINDAREEAEEKYTHLGAVGSLTEELYFADTLNN